jgi:hypothetical protein
VYLFYEYGYYFDITGFPFVFIGSPRYLPFYDMSSLTYDQMDNMFE